MRAVREVREWRSRKNRLAPESEKLFLEVSQTIPAWIGIVDDSCDSRCDVIGHIFEGKQEEFSAFRLFLFTVARGAKIW